MEERKEKMQLLLRNMSEFPPSDRCIQNDRHAKQLIAVNEWSDIFVVGRENHLVYSNFSSDSSSVPVATELKSYTSSDILCKSTCRSTRIPPDIDIIGILFSPDGESLLVWGNHYACIILLPARARDGSLDVNPEQAEESGFQLLDISPYIVDRLKSRICDARWHPLSSNGCICLLVTTINLETRLLFFSMTDILSNNDVDPIPNQEINLQQKLGPETVPVSMDFGVDGGWNQFSVYILTDVGDISCLCPILPFDSIVRLDSLSDLAKMSCMKLATMEGASDSDFDKDNFELNEKKKDLEQQILWLQNVFGKSFGITIESDGKMHRVKSACPVVEETWVQVANMDYIEQNPPILQVQKCTREDSANEIATKKQASAFSLVSIRSQIGYWGSNRSRLGGSSVVARSYVSGYIDIILFIGGIVPMFENEYTNKYVYNDIYEDSCVVMECLDVSVDEDNDWKSNPMLISDPCKEWTFHIYTKNRIIMVSLNWTNQISRWSKSLKGQTLHQTRGAMRNSRFELPFDDESESIDEPLPSTLLDILNIPSCDTSTESQSTRIGTNSTIIVGCVVIGTPILGHLVLVRLSDGCLELANLSVLAAEADEQYQVISRKNAESLEKEDAFIHVGMTQPYIDMIQNATRRIKNDLEKVRNQKGQRNQVRVTEANASFLADLSKQSREYTSVSIGILSSELGVLRRKYDQLDDAHAYQIMQLKRLVEDIDKLNGNQEKLMLKQSRIEENTRNLASRAADVLGLCQMLLPRMTKAQIDYMEELQRWRSQTSRWKDTVSSLERTAEEDVRARISMRDDRLSPQQLQEIQRCIRSDAVSIREAIDTLKKIVEMHGKPAGK